MYFKRLEMFGFKSFADKTKINFERGITAVVGPNGCGKSNISDAVKWVLGEQSAKELRGSNMQDIIFNGTEQREPLGYAEVALTLSNESKFLPIEYDEVTISRRLYRSGESEYFLNKNLVRLKDINEILMGSGIGTSAYSMIEQGRIDQILSANADERREVFEEASGITKYKSKKREAARKLDETEQNLLRVNDIVKEVERQINSIERQARKAKRYQEHFDKLKGLDTKLSAHKYKNLKEKKQAFDSETGDIKNKEETLVKFLSEFNRAMSQLKDNLDILTSRISQYTADLQNADMSLQRNHDRVTLNRERLQELHKTEADQKEEINSLNKRVEETTRAVNDITHRLSSITETTRSKEELLTAREEELNNLRDEIENKNTSIKNNKFEIVDILAIQSRMRNEVTKATSDMQNVSSRLRRLDLEKENVSGELATLERNLREARMTVNIVISRVEALENERIAFQNSLKNERQSFTELEKDITDSKNNIISLSSKLNFLKELVKRHEGFTGGTQVLLNALSSGQFKIDGFCRPLAELVEPIKGYEQACEAALMGDLQTLVVDDWATAHKAIDYLKKNHLGKASFIRGGQADTHILDNEKIHLDNQAILGNMADFAKTDSEYSTLFARLLNNTFVVNSIEDAVSILKPLPYNVQKKVRLVTKAGDVVTKELLTAGGIIEDFTSSIIGRRMRIKETEELMADSEKKILTMKQELQAKKEVIEIQEQETKKIEDKLREEEIDLAQKRSSETNLEKMHKKIKEEIDLVDLEVDETLLRQDELKAKETEVKAKLKETEEEEAALQNSNTESMEFIDNGAKRKEELLINITQAQTELTSLKKEEDDIYIRAQTQKNYHDDQVSILNNKKASLEDACQRQKSLHDEIERRKSDSKHLEDRRSIIGKELATLEGEKEELTVVINEKEGDIQKRRETLSSIKDRNHNVEMEEAQISFQMETLRNKIGQLYKVDLEGMLEENQELEDCETIEKEVAELTKAIEKIGPVNLVAIDEHKELEERFMFLKSQEEDLLNAKEQLHKAIKKINQTTKELFIETFTSIQAEFRNYFRFLFGGGKAEIILLDEKDVLESGIEIIVRPPGKKLQTLSLLSGGEKALTAIALLFAIFKVKPSPFCLLDEIDAPLDESNIGRFGKALQEFAKKSQFIIITHNKKTINASDVMYGITMQQSGVSRIISVKFKKAKEEEQKQEILT